MNKAKALLICWAVLLTLASCDANQDINIQSSETVQNSSEATVSDNEEQKNSYSEAEYSGQGLEPDSIEYLGAFLLPDDGGSEREMFSYGGEALCYNAKNNSLFITGHNWYADIAEITIPEPIVSKDTSKLNKSEIIQGLSDVKGSLFSGWSMEIPRAGLEVVGGTLFFCYGQHFEEEVELGTHGYTDLNLSEASKVCIVGDKRYTANDYMFSVPESYTELFGEADLLTGRFRDGGWGCMGPSLQAIKSEDIINSQNNEKISSSLIIGYDDSYDGNEGAKVDGYSDADSWAGGALISCSAGDAIIFVGTHGYGDTWYGFSNGVVYPTSGDEDEKVPEVPDYPHDERGWWNDDFRACIMFYDVTDAVKIYSGELEPYEIQPYAYLDLSEYMLIKRDETAMQYLGACAYDIAGNNLYVLEMLEEGALAVHVFTFN